jgi:Domain of unknown function (DUF5710)
MKINLVSPFAEKDAAKALGARWDSAKKTWYVTDVADLTPFQRWIPNMEADTATAFAATRRTAPRTPQVLTEESKGAITGPSLDVPHCGCEVLPWEDCVHTATS